MVIHAPILPYNWPNEKDILQCFQRKAGHRLRMDQQKLGAQSDGLATHVENDLTNSLCGNATKAWAAQIRLTAAKHLLQQPNMRVQWQPNTHALVRMRQQWTAWGSERTCEHRTGSNCLARHAKNPAEARLRSRSSGPSFRRTIPCSATELFTDFLCLAATEGPSRSPRYQS